MRNLFQYVGLRHLKLKPGRVLLTTLGVAFGIALYVAIAIINHSTKNSLRESIESISGKAKLTISAGAAGFDEAKLETIRVVDGVKSAVPMVEARAFFEGATESNQGLYILGVDLLQESAVRTYKATDQRVIDDPLTFLNQPDSIVLTQTLAKQKGLTLDSKVKLATALGVKTFTVRGLLEPEGAAKAYGGSLAIMDIDGARMMFGKENKLDRVDIVTRDGFQTEQVRENLEKALGPGLTIESPETQSSQMESMLDSYQIILTFFSTLALLVGLFLVMNSISVAVAERRREIGTLRALGATRGSMVILFVSEIFGIGLIGSVLGCLIGRALAEKLVTQITTSVAAQFQIRLEVTHLEFTPKQMMLSIVLGTIASVFAAMVPALKAAKIHPLESMKQHAENFSKEDEGRSRNMILFGLVLLIFMTCSMVFSWGRNSFVLDILTKGSSVIGSAFFGPFLVFILIYGFRFITRRMRGPVLKLSQENLIRSRRRTTSNVMALMVGLYLVMLIATVRSSFNYTLMNWLDRIFVADMMVASSGRMITADVQPLKEEIQKELEKVPGVRAIGEGHGMGTRVVPFYYHGKKMMLKAHDHFADFYQYRAFGVMNADRVETAKKLYASLDPQTLVTPNFLERQHKQVGDTIELDTPSGRIPFKIIGEVLDYASPEGVLYLNRAVYKKYWNDPMVTAFLINKDDGYTLEQVRSAIDQRLGRKWNLVTISNAEFKGQMHQAIERTFAYTKAIELIALLVGLLGLLNTLLISVMERTREIGMLRAVGTTRSQISRMVMLEALLQGLFGAAVAVILGAYVGRLFVIYGLSTNLGWIIEFHFPKEAIFSTLITGVIVAIIAGLLPARRASRLNIVEALDYE
jgi:putative ABC transport system permease protein